MQNKSRGICGWRRESLLGWGKILGGLFNKHTGALRHGELFTIPLVEVVAAD